MMCLIVLTRDSGAEVTASSVLLTAEHMLLQDNVHTTTTQPHPQETKFLRNTKNPKEQDEETFNELKEKFMHVEDTLDKIHGVMHDGIVQKRDFLDDLKLDGKHNKEHIKELEEKLEDAEDKMKDLEELFTLI